MGTAASRPASRRRLRCLPGLSPDAALPFPAASPSLQAVNWAIQNGCGLSRARVLTFKHNDVADLERVLQSVAKEDKKSRRVHDWGRGGEGSRGA